MERFCFHIQIHGLVPDTDYEVAPETLSVSALFEVLQPVERSLLAMATAAGLDLAGQPVLALAGAVKTGSADALVQTPGMLREAAAALTRAMATGDWEAIPAPARRPLHDLSRLASRRAWRVRFEPHEGAELTAADISAAQPVPAAPADMVRELTHLYGELLLIGGVDETKYGRLRLHDGRVVPLEMDAALAKSLAPRLFEEVCLDGVAEWDLVSMQVVRFEAHGLIPYQATLPDEAFRALRDVVGDAFDDLDPAAFQRRVRQGESG